MPWDTLKYPSLPPLKEIDAEGAIGKESSTMSFFPRTKHGLKNIPSSTVSRGYYTFNKHWHQLVSRDNRLAPGSDHLPGVAIGSKWYRSSNWQFNISSTELAVTWDTWSTTHWLVLQRLPYNVSPIQGGNGYGCSINPSVCIYIYIYIYIYTECVSKIRNILV